MTDSETESEDEPKPVIAADRGDADVRPKIDSLIAGGGMLASILEEGAFQEEEATIAPTERLPFGNLPTPVVDTSLQIGRYKLIEEIGEGGFGMVYRAEQKEPVARTVALKVIKPGMDSREIIARFESERQTLALMEHPNIATVLDGGTTDTGRLFFVMELVKGIPITKYCDRHRLDTKHRLSLFLQVCAAIQHAHQKGIIHRDIKPSNILITTADSEPMVKVIDFGIAKAFTEGSDNEAFTLRGQIIGTPQYMSPEQADNSHTDIDTRSDIYSLGVLLYELLTGTTPIDPKALKKAGHDGIHRLICDEQPRKPSTRVATTVTKKDSTSLATRGEEPRQVAQMLRGDLDWIILKALEKERDRRYDTARGFARDIEAFLNNEAVSASPPTAFYLLRKFTARHRGLIAAMTAIAMSLILGTVGMTLLYFRAETSRQSAVHNLEVAERERTRAKQAQTAEQQARQRAEAQADHNRRLLYSSDMQLAARNWESPAGKAQTVAELLAAQIPGPEEEDLRDFAWRHQWHALNRGARTTVVEDAVVDAAITADGALITLNQAMILRRWQGDGSEPERETNLGLGARKDDLAALTPDGLKVVHLRTNTVRVFAVNTGRPGRSFPIAGNPVRLLFSAGSKFVAVFDSDSKRMRTWNLESGEPGESFIKTFAESTMPVAFAPGAKELIRNTKTASQSLFWLQARKRVHKFETTTHEWSIQSAAWAPDGGRLASGDGSGAVIVRRGTEFQSANLIKPHSSKVTQLCFSTTGDRLASAGIEGDIVVTDLSTGSSIARLKGHTDAIRSLRFSADGKLLASVSRDGTARLWELDHPPGRSRLEIRHVGAEIKSVDGKTEAHFTGLANLPTNILRIVTGELRPDDRIIGIRIGTNGPFQKIAGMRGDEALGRIQGEEKSTFQFEVQSPRRGETAPRLVSLARGPKIPGSNRLVFSADGRWLAAQVGTQILVWDWQGNRPTWRVPDPGSAAAFSPDGRLLAVNDRRAKKVKLWDLETHQLVNSWDFSPVGDLTFSHDGYQLAASQGFHLRTLTGTNTSQIRVFDLTKRRNRTFEGHDRWVSGIAFSPDDSLLLTAGQDGILKIWNSEDGSLRAESSPVNESLSCLRISPDGRTAVAGGWGGTVFLWDARTGKLLDMLDSHSAIVTAVDFSPDGWMLATSSSDRTIKLWDLRHRQLLRTLTGHDRIVIGLSFARDGNALVSGARQGGILVWPATPLSEIERHPLTINSMNNLALTHLRRGPYDRAAELFRHVADRRREQLGPEHPLTLRTITSLGHALRKQEGWSDAMTVWETNLKTHLSAFGPDDQRSWSLLDELSNLYSNRVVATSGSADTICERAIETFERLLGPDHPRSIPILLLAAQSKRESGNHPAAVAAAQRALDVAQNRQATNYHQLAAIRHELGLALAGNGDSERAAEELRVAIQLRRDHPEEPSRLGASLSALVQVLTDRKTEAADDDAMQLCREAVRPPVAHELKETIYRQLATLYERRGNNGMALAWKAHAEVAGQRYEASIPWYAEALELQRAKLGEKHKLTEDTRDRLASNARRVGNEAGIVGDLPKAVRFLRLSRDVKPFSSIFEFKFAAALHQTGDQEGLRTLLREMLKQYRRTRRTSPREQTAKCVFALLPEPDLLAEAIPMARTTFKRNPDLIWPGIGCSLADIRAGEFQAAEDRLAQLEASPVHLEQRAMIHVCRALARQRLGHDVADLIKQTEILAAEFRVDSEHPRGDWHDPIIVNTLLAEAKAAVAQTSKP